MGFLFTNKLRIVPASIQTANSVSGTIAYIDRLRSSSPGSAVLCGPDAYSCKQPPGGPLPRTGSKPAFTGFASLVKALCGRDARVPRGLARAWPVRLWKNLIGLPCWTSTTIRRIAHPWYPYKRQTLFLERIAYIDRLPWLVIPRERGRLARILIPANSLPPRPLPRKVHQTRLYGGSCRSLLCRGLVPGTPAFPGGLVRARRPRSRGGFYADISRSGAAGPGVGAAWGRPGPWRTGWVAG